MEISKPKIAISIMVIIVIMAVLMAIPNTSSKYVDEDEYKFNIETYNFFYAKTYSQLSNSTNVSASANGNVINNNKELIGTVNGHGYISLPYKGYYAIVTKGGNGSNGAEKNKSSNYFYYPVPGGRGGVMVGYYYVAADNPTLNTTLEVCIGDSGKIATIPSNGLLGLGGTNYKGIGNGGNGCHLGSSWENKNASGGGGAATLLYDNDSSTKNNLLMIASGGGASASCDMGAIGPSYTGTDWFAPGEGGYGGTNVQALQTWVHVKNGLDKNTTKNKGWFSLYSNSSYRTDFYISAFGSGFTQDKLSTSVSGGKVYYGLDGGSPYYNSTSYLSFGKGATSNPGNVGTYSDSGYKGSNGQSYANNGTGGNAYNSGTASSPSGGIGGGGGGGYAGGGSGSGVGTTAWSMYSGSAGGGGGGSSFISDKIGTLPDKYYTYMLDKAGFELYNYPDGSIGEVEGARQSYVTNREGFVIVMYLGDFNSKDNFITALNS